MRHTGSPPRKNKKSRSPKRTERGQDQDKDQDQRNAKMAAKKSEKPEPESVMKEKFLKELEQEDNGVAQRIRELKEQKMQRDKLAGKQSVDEDAGGAPAAVPHVSVIPSPESSPTSIVSSMSEKRVQDLAKAHKILGISVDAVPIEKPADSLARKLDVGEYEPPGSAAAPQTRTLRHARHRSLTVNDGDDLTPLPKIGRAHV